jgi:hypothetical protein
MTKQLVAELEELRAWLDGNPDAPDDYHEIAQRALEYVRAHEPKAPDFRALLEEAWKTADGNEGDHVLGSDLNERIKSALNLLAEPKGCQLQNARVCAEWPACVCGRTLGSVVNRGGDA